MIPIKGSHGNVISRLEEQGENILIFEGSMCRGRYNKRYDKTFTISGRYVGTGNLLSMLIEGDRK